MNRVTSERLLRTVGVSALLLAWWASYRVPVPSISACPLRGPALLWSDSSARALGDSVRTRIIAASHQAHMARAPDATRATTLPLVLPMVPAQVQRALLGALRYSLAPVWIDSTRARGFALALAPVVSPQGGLAVRISAGSLAPIVITDAGGVIDSVRVGNAMSWRLASATDGVTARRGNRRDASRAWVAVPEAIRVKRLYLFANPGWEAKFVVAALEEQGWSVDGALRAAPATIVTIGAPQRLDTARYAAALVLDSTAVDAGTITRFVRQGGGLVLAGDALRIPSLATVRPLRITGLRGAVPGALLTASPRRGLQAWEVSLAQPATVLDVDSGGHAHADPVLIARRVGAGRVLASVYRESWRWRMEGSDDGADAHRRWWTSLVGMVAYGSPPIRSSAGALLPGDAAPYADLVARLGAATAPDAPPRAATAATPPAVGVTDWISDRVHAWTGLLYVMAALAFLMEWGSRRLRGAR